MIKAKNITYLAKGRDALYVWPEYVSPFYPSATLSNKFVQLLSHTILNLRKLFDLENINSSKIVIVLYLQYKTYIKVYVVSRKML